jgi:two-component system cell cycle sensor histidine kinase/response regulator CckA
MAQAITILAVEDNDDDTALMTRELIRRGFTPSITRVEEAGELRAALRTGTWDVVISDYSMPLLDAPGALSVVQESGKDVPFIVVTGSIGEDRATAIMKAGAHDFILKGNLGRLGAAIERAIGDARVRADHRAALGALRATNHELTTFFEASPLAIIVLGAGATVRRWNAAATRMFGWSAEEAVARELPTIPPAARLESLAIVADAWRGRSFTAVEVAWRRKDETPIAVALSVASLRSGGDAVDGIIILASDIGERRSLEAQVRQIQKMEIVGQLAGGIAHDFNNLLTVINGRCELLLARLAGQEESLHDVGLIRETGARAARMTRQLLAFSRRQEFTPSDVDLRELVGEMRKMLVALVGPGIALACELGARLPPVRSDASQLEQVVLNLAVNARDAMGGTGRLVISTRLASAEELASRGVPAAGQFCCLAVSDTGCGMDEATRARIFEPFYTTKEQGTGLGLSTVDGIVRQSGGFIRVDSTPGAGTSFAIYLAAAAPPLTDEESRHFHPEAVRDGTTVLAVDGDIAVRTMISRSLTRYGYQVFTAANLVQALEVVALKQGRIQLLITEVMTASMSGTAIASALLPRCPGMKLLYMTDEGGPAPEDAGELLRKPFTPSRLAALVRKLVRRD